jgi:hypothetical protein
LSRPDVVNQLPNGWTEEITFRKHFRADGSVGRTRRVKDAQGVTREVWHDVVSRDGTTIHEAHLKYRSQEPPHDPD